MRNRRLVPTQLLLATVVALLATSSAAAAQDTSVGDIFGTLTFKGCIPVLQEVTVRAVSTNLPGATMGGGGKPAEVTPTTDSRQFEFRIGGLQFGKIYAVQAGAVPNSCGKVIVQAEDSGFTIAGSGSPVALTVYAIRTRFDVLALANTRRAAATWVPAEGVDLTTPGGATRRVRFSSALAGVTGYQVQVSTNPFPKSTRQISNSCDEPATGVFYRQFVAAGSREGERTRGNEVEALLDFHLLVNSGSSGDGTALLPDADRRMVNLGAPLHVRAVPVTAAGLACETTKVGLNPEIVIAQQPPEIGDIAFTVAPPLKVVPFIYNRPIFDFSQGYKTCALVIREHPIYAGMGAKVWDKAYFDTYPQKATAEIGDKFCLSPYQSSDASWLSQAGTIVGGVYSGVFDAASWALDNAAKFWDDAKALAVQIAAEAISATGLYDCEADPKCQAALMIALTYAMASMGVPPSIPNFDQLMTEGVDYIAARAASEVGVPEYLAEEVAEHAYELAKNEIDKAKEKRAVAGMPDWIIPDLGWQYAHATVSLIRTGTDLVKPDLFTLGGNRLFLGTVFDIPSRWPGHFPGDPDRTQLAVPITLMPDVSIVGGLPINVKIDPSPLAIPLYYKDAWNIWFQNSGCERWKGLVIGRLPNGDLTYDKVLDGTMFTTKNGFLLDPFFSYCKVYYE
jgi:hypothetical protein